MWVPKNRRELRFLRKSAYEQSQRRVASEVWFASILKENVKDEWDYQYIVGGRIFDFWFPEKRIAIEVDGKKYHDRKKDLERDSFYQKRFDLKVCRVWAFNKSDALKAVQEISKCPKKKKKKKRKKQLAAEKLERQNKLKKSRLQAKKKSVDVALERREKRLRLLHIALKR